MQTNINVLCVVKTQLQLSTIATEISRFFSAFSGYYVRNYMQERVRKTHFSDCFSDLYSIGFSQEQDFIKFMLF